MEKGIKITCNEEQCIYNRKEICTKKDIVIVSGKCRDKMKKIVLTPDEKELIALALFTLSCEDCQYEEFCEEKEIEPCMKVKNLIKKS